METLIRNGLVDEIDQESTNRRNLLINAVTSGLLVAAGISSAYLYQSTVYTPSGFQRISPTQYIAAKMDPTSSEGVGAQEWGIWTKDPGPRGTYLRDYDKQLVSNDYVSPVYQWIFDPKDWWVEEHGIIMESPTFPLPSGRYLVTGGRMVTTGLTINKDGSWKLDDGHTLYDVTHLPCRSGRYQSPSSSSSCSPNNANLRNFPVAPGAAMPIIQGCNKEDYAVLFVVGKAI